MVSVLHKKLEYKEEKFNYKIIRGRGVGGGGLKKRRGLLTFFSKKQGLIREWGLFEGAGLMED